MHQPPDRTTPHRHRKQALRAVASFEFIKGLGVLLMGVCALLLVHQDVWLIAESLLAAFHINTDRHFAQVFLDFADNVTDARLWAAARIAFAYAALRFAEAYGLWRQRAWAEWIACVSGALLLPLEVRELLHKVTLLRAAILVGNLGIVVYMFYVLRTGYREKHRPAFADLPETGAGSGK
jgi:uncharacterized membrane protein (DUF2068 family)